MPWLWSAEGVALDLLAELQNLRPVPHLPIRQRKSDYACALKHARWELPATARRDASDFRWRVRQGSMEGGLKRGVPARIVAVPGSAE